MTDDKVESPFGLTWDIFLVLDGFTFLIFAYYLIIISTLSKKKKVLRCSNQKTICLRIEGEREFFFLKKKKINEKRLKAAVAVEVLLQRQKLRLLGT